MEKIQSVEDFNSSLIYEERYLAFIDILGWKELVYKSTTDPELLKNIGSFIRYIQGHVYFANAETLSDLQVTHISDSMVLSVNASCGLPFLFINSIFSCIEFFMKSGILLRGAITKGLLIHKKSLIFGPALNRAYELEQKCAVNPRILFSSELINELSKQHELNQEIYINLWRADDDGHAFFHYLRPQVSFKTLQSSNIKYENLLKMAHKLIIRGLKEYKNKDGVFKKYEWMASYYNNVIDENPDLGLEKINEK